jgi:WD40 repeat protein
MFARLLVQENYVRHLLLSFVSVATFAATIPAAAQTTDAPTLVVNSAHQAIRKIAFSPDGRWIAAAGDSTIKLWDIGTGRLLRTLIGHSSLIDNAIIAPDGRYLYSVSSSDRSIKVWESETGRYCRQLPARTHKTHLILFRFR